MSKSILVVEDDPEVRQSLVDLLEDEGYTVLAAINGKQGLEVLETAEPLPGLIFLDIMMPILNGYEFRKIQEKQPLLAAIPTVLLSADGQISEKAQTAGVKEYVKKPIDLSLLFDLAQKYCGV